MVKPAHFSKTCQVSKTWQVGNIELKHRSHVNNYFMPASSAVRPIEARLQSLMINQ
jgi:hypothetical protein